MRGTVFVDYDGTITEADTFDVLVQYYAGAEAWKAIELQLQAGEITIREALQTEASLVRATLDEAWAVLERSIRFDPTFAAFVEDCEQREVSLTIVSSGVEPVIRRALAVNGLARVPVVANAVDTDPSGWRIDFRDKLANGTDKAKLVRAERARGTFVTYIGDGLSDFDAALEADYVYARRGRRLERFLASEGVAFTPFSTFAELIGKPRGLAR